MSQEISVMEPGACIRSMLELLYSRPVPPDAISRVVAMHDVAIPEVQAAIKRAEQEIQRELEAARQLGLEYRGSKVTVLLGELTVAGDSAHATASVYATWRWGYPGSADETPMKSFNQHHLQLMRTDNQWLITQHQHLASNHQAMQQLATPKPQVQPLVEPAPLPPEYETYYYNRGRARDYALRYYQNPNPAYVNYTQTEGGDCTNFTSQAVRDGGGYPTRGLYGDLEWWYAPGHNPKHSWPWSIANSQAFWMSRHYGDYIRDRHDNEVNLVYNHDVARRLRLGDLLYYDLTGDDRVFDHSAIVTGFNASGYPLVTYHNSRGNNPQRDAHFALPGATLIYGVVMYDSVRVPAY